MSSATAAVDDPKQRLKEKLDHLLERADQKRLVLDQTKHMFAVGEMNHVLYMRTLADADRSKHLVVDAVGGLLHHHFKNIIAAPVKSVLRANRDNTSDDSTSLDPRVYFVNLYQTLLNELDTEYDADNVGGVTGATSGHWSNTISGSGSYRQRVKQFLSDALDRMAEEFVKKDLLTASFVPTCFDMSHFKAMLFVYSLTDYARKRLDTKVIDAAAMVGIYAADSSADEHERLGREFYEAFIGGKTGKLDNLINRVVSWFTGSQPSDVVQSEEEAKVMVNLKTASDALWKRFESHYTKKSVAVKNLEYSLSAMLAVSRLAIQTPEKLRLATPLVDTFVRNFIGSNEIDAVDSTLNAFQANSLNMSLSKLTGYDGGGGDYFLDDEKWLKTSTDKIKSSGANGDSSEAKMGVFDLMQSLSELRKSYFAHTQQYFFEKTLPQLEKYAIDKLKPVAEFGLDLKKLRNSSLSGKDLQSTRENYKKYITWIVKRDLFKGFYQSAVKMKDNVTKDNGQIHQNVYDVLVMHTMYDIIEDLDEQDKPLFLAEEILVRLFRVVHICTRSRSILAGEDKYTLPKAYLASEHQDLIDRLLLVQPYETSASSVDQARINSSLQYDDPNGHTWGTFLKSVTTDATKNTLHVEALRDICTDKLQHDERFTSVPGSLFKALFAPVCALLARENSITNYVLYSMDDSISIDQKLRGFSDLLHGAEQFKTMFKGNKFHELNSKLGLSENIVVPANPEVYLRDVLVAAKKIGASVLADVATTESETQLIDDGDDDEAIELASVVSSHLSLVSGSDNNSQQQQQNQDGSLLHVQHQMTMIDTISTSGVSIMSPRSSILGDEGETIELVNDEDEDDEDDEVIEIDDDDDMMLEEEEAHQAPTTTLGIGQGVAQQQQQASDLNQAQQAAAPGASAFFKNIFGL